MISKLLKGGDTTNQKLVIEFIYLTVSAIIGSWIAYLTKNPGVLPGQWLGLTRLILGLVANAVNSQLN